MQRLQQKLISYVLDTVLDIADIDPEGYQSSIYNGEFELKGVALRPTKINKLIFGHESVDGGRGGVGNVSSDSGKKRQPGAFEIEVTNGRADRLRIAIPVLSVTTVEPIRAILEGVTVTVAPRKRHRPKVTASCTPTTTAPHSDSNVAALERDEDGDDSDDFDAEVEYPELTYLTREQVLAALSEELVLGIDDGLMQDQLTSLTESGGEGPNVDGISKHPQDKEVLQNEAAAADVEDDAGSSSVASSSSGDDVVNGQSGTRRLEGMYTSADGLYQSEEEDINRPTASDDDDNNDDDDSDFKSAQGSDEENEEDAAFEDSSLQQPQGWFNYLKSSAASMVPAAWKAPRTYIIELRDISIVMDCTPPSSTHIPNLNGTELSPDFANSRKEQSVIAKISSVVVTIHPSVSAPAASGMQRGIPQDEQKRLTSVEIGAVHVSISTTTATPPCTKQPQSPPRNETLTTSHSVLVIPAASVSSTVTEIVPRDLSFLVDKGHLVKTRRQEVVVEQQDVWQLRADASTLGLLQSCALGFLGVGMGAAVPLSSDCATKTPVDIDEVLSSTMDTLIATERAEASRHAKKLWRRGIRRATACAKDRARRYHLSLSNLRDVRDVRSQYISLLRTLMQPGGGTKFEMYKDQLAMLELEIKYRDVVFFLRRMVHAEFGSTAALDNAITVSRTSEYLSRQKDAVNSDLQVAESAGSRGTYISSVDLPMVVRAAIAGINIDCPGGYILQILALQALVVKGISSRVDLGFIGLRATSLAARQGAVGSSSSSPAIRDLVFPRADPQSAKGTLLIFAGTPPTTTNAVEQRPCISFSHFVEGPFSTATGNENGAAELPTSPATTVPPPEPASGANNVTQKRARVSTLRFQEPDASERRERGDRTEDGRRRRPQSAAGVGGEAVAAYLASVTIDVAPITFTLKSSDVVRVVHPLAEAVTTVQIAIQKTFRFQARLSARFDPIVVRVVDPTIQPASNAKAFARSRLQRLREHNMTMKKVAASNAGSSESLSSSTSSPLWMSSGRYVVEIARMDVSVAPISASLDGLSIRIQSIQVTRVSSSGSSGSLLCVSAARILVSVDGMALLTIPSIKTDQSKNLIVLPDLSLTSSDAAITTLRGISSEIATIKAAMDALAAAASAGYEDSGVSTALPKDTSRRPVDDDDADFGLRSDFDGGSDAGGQAMSAYSGTSRSIAPSMDFSATPSTASALQSRKAIRQAQLTKRIKAAVFEVLNRSLKAKKNLIDGLSLIPSLVSFHRHSASRRATGVIVHSLTIKHESVMHLDATNLHISFAQRATKSFDMASKRMRKVAEPSTNISMTSCKLLLFAATTKIDMSGFWLEITSAPGGVAPAPVIHMLADKTDVFMCKMAPSGAEGDAPSSPEGSQTKSRPEPKKPSQTSSPTVSGGDRKRIPLYGHFPDASLLSLSSIRLASCARHTDFLANGIDLCGGGVVVSKVGMNVTPRPGVTVVDTRPTVASDLDANITLCSIDLRRLGAASFEAVPIAVMEHVVPLAKRLMAPLAIRLFMSSLTHVVLTVMETKAPIISYNGYVAVVEILPGPSSRVHLTGEEGDIDNSGGEKEEAYDDNFLAEISRGQQRLTPAALGAVSGGNSELYSQGLPPPREWSPRGYIPSLPGSLHPLPPIRRNFYQRSTTSDIRPYGTRHIGGGAPSVLSGCDTELSRFVDGSEEDARSTGMRSSRAGSAFGGGVRTAGGSQYPFFNMGGEGSTVRRLGGGTAQQTTPTIPSKRFTLTVSNDTGRMMNQLTVEHVAVYISPFSATAPNSSEGRCRMLIELTKLERVRPMPREDYWTHCPPTLSQSTTVACPNIHVTLSRSPLTTPATAGTSSAPDSARQQSPAEVAAESLKSRHLTAEERREPSPPAKSPSTPKPSSKFSESRSGSQQQLLKKRPADVSNARDALATLGATQLLFESSTTEVSLSSYCAPSDLLEPLVSTLKGAKAQNASINQQAPASPSQSNLEATSTITKPGEANSTSGQCVGSPLSPGSSSGSSNFGDSMGLADDDDAFLEALDEARNEGGTTAQKMDDDVLTSQAQQVRQLRRALEASSDISAGSINAHWAVTTADDWIAARECIAGIISVFADRRQHEVICPLGHFVCTNCSETTTVRELKPPATSSPHQQPTVVFSQEVFDFSKTLLSVMASPETSSQRASLLSARNREIANISQYILSVNGGVGTSPSPLPTPRQTKPDDDSSETPPTPHPTPTAATSQSSPVLFIFEECIFVERPDVDSIVSLTVLQDTIVVFRRCTFAAPGCTKKMLKHTVSEPHATSVVTFVDCRWVTHNPLAHISLDEIKGRDTLFKAVSKSEMFRGYSTSDLPSLDGTSSPHLNVIASNNNDASSSYPDSPTSPTVKATNAKKASTRPSAFQDAATDQQRGGREDTVATAAQDNAGTDGPLWGIERYVRQIQVLSTRILFTVSQSKRSSVLVEAGKIVFSSDAVTSRKSAAHLTPPTPEGGGVNASQLTVAALRSRGEDGAPSPRSREIGGHHHSHRPTSLSADTVLQCVHVNSVQTDKYLLAEGISVKCIVLDAEIKVLPKGTASINSERKWAVARVVHAPPPPFSTVPSTRPAATIRSSRSMGTTQTAPATFPQQRIVNQVSISNLHEPQTSLVGEVSLQSFTIPLSMVDTLTHLSEALSASSNLYLEEFSTGEWSGRYLPPGAVLRPHTADDDIVAKQLACPHLPAGVDKVTAGKSISDAAAKLGLRKGGFWSPSTDSHDLWMGRRSILRGGDKPGHPQDKSAAAFAREIDSTSGSRKMLSLIPSFRKLGALTVNISVPQIGAVVLLPTGCPLAKMSLFNVVVESGSSLHGPNLPSQQGSNNATSGSLLRTSNRSAVTPTSNGTSLSEWPQRSGTSPQMNAAPSTAAANNVNIGCVKLVTTTKLVIEVYDMCKKQWNGVLDPTLITVGLIRTEPRATVSLHISSINVNIPSAALRTISFATAFFGRHRAIGDQRARELREIRDHTKPSNGHSTKMTSPPEEGMSPHTRHPPHTSVMHALHNESGVPIEVHFADGQHVSLGVGASLTRLDPFSARVDAISASALPKVKVAPFHTVTLSRYYQHAGYASPPVVAPVGMVPQDLCIPPVFANEDPDVLFAEQSLTYVGDGMELRIERVFDSSFSEVIRIRTCFLVENHTPYTFVLESNTHLTAVPMSAKRPPQATAVPDASSEGSLSQLPSAVSDGDVSPLTQRPEVETFNDTPKKEPPARVVIGPQSRISVPCWLLDDPFAALRSASAPLDVVRANLRGRDLVLSEPLMFNTSLRSLSQSVIDKGYASLRRTAVLAFPRGDVTKNSSDARSKKRDSEPVIAHAISLVAGVSKSTHTAVLHIHHACPGIYNSTRTAITASYLKGTGEDNAAYGRSVVSSWLASASASAVSLFASPTSLPASARQIVSQQVAQPQEIGWLHLRDTRRWLQNALLLTIDNNDNDNSSSQGVLSQRLTSWEPASAMVVIEMSTPRGIYASDPISLSTSAMLSLQGSIVPCPLRLRKPLFAANVVGGSRAATTLQDMRSTTDLYCPSKPPTTASFLGGIFSSFLGGETLEQQQQRLLLAEYNARQKSKSSVDILQAPADPDVLDYPNDWDSPGSVATDDVILVNLVAGTHGSLPIIHVTPHEDFTYIVNRSGTPLQLVATESGMNSTIYNEGESMDDTGSAVLGAGKVPGLGDTAVPSGGTVYVPSGRYRLRPPGGSESTKDIAFVDALDLSIVDAVNPHHKQSLLRQSFIIQRQGGQGKRAKQFPACAGAAERQLFGPTTGGFRQEGIPLEAGWASYGNSSTTTLQTDEHCRLHGLCSFPHAAIEILPVFLVTNSDPHRYLLVEHRARASTSNFATGSHTSVVGPGEIHPISLKAEARKLDEFRFAFANPTEGKVSATPYALSSPSSSPSKTTMVGDTKYTLITHFSEFVCVRDFSHDDFSLIPLELTLASCGQLDGQKVYTLLRLVFPVVAGPMELFVDPLVCGVRHQTPPPRCPNLSSRAPLTIVNLSAVDFVEAPRLSVTSHLLNPVSSRILLHPASDASGSAGRVFHMGFVDSSGPLLVQDMTDAVCAAEDAVLLGLMHGGDPSGGNEILGLTPIKTRHPTNEDEDVSTILMGPTSPPSVTCTIKAYDCPDYGRRFVAVLADGASNDAAEAQTQILFNGSVPFAASTAASLPQSVGNSSASAAGFTTHSKHHHLAHHQRSTSIMSNTNISEGGANVNDGASSNGDKTSASTGQRSSAAAAGAAEVQSLHITLTADDVAITLLDSAFAAAKSSSPNKGAHKPSPSSNHDADDATADGERDMVPQLQIRLGRLYCSTRFLREPTAVGPRTGDVVSSSQPQWGTSSIAGAPSPTSQRAPHHATSALVNQSETFSRIEVNFERFAVVDLTEASEPTRAKALLQGPYILDPTSFGLVFSGSDPLVEYSQLNASTINFSVSPLRLCVSDLCLATIMAFGENASWSGSGDSRRERLQEELCRQRREVDAVTNSATAAVTRRQNSPGHDSARTLLQQRSLYPVQASFADGSSMLVPRVPKPVKSDSQVKYLAADTFAISEIRLSVSWTRSPGVDVLASVPVLSTLLQSVDDAQLTLPPFELTNLHRKPVGEIAKMLRDAYQSTILRQWRSVLGGLKIFGVSSITAGFGRIGSSFSRMLTTSSETSNPSMLESTVGQPAAAAVNMATRIFGSWASSAQQVPKISAPSSNPSDSILEQTDAAKTIVVPPAPLVGDHSWLCFHCKAITERVAGNSTATTAASSSTTVDIRAELSYILLRYGPAAVAHHASAKDSLTLLEVEINGGPLFEEAPTAAVTSPSTKAPIAEVVAILPSHQQQSPPPPSHTMDGGLTLAEKRSIEQIGDRLQATCENALVLATREAKAANQRAKEGSKPQMASSALLHFGASNLILRLRNPSELLQAALSKGRSDTLDAINGTFPNSVQTLLMLDANKQLDVAFYTHLVDTLTPVYAEDGDDAHQQNHDTIMRATTDGTFHLLSQRINPTALEECYRKLMMISTVSREGVSSWATDRIQEPVSSLQAPLNYKIPKRWSDGLLWASKQSNPLSTPGGGVHVPSVHVLRMLGLVGVRQQRSNPTSAEASSVRTYAIGSTLGAVAAASTILGLPNPEELFQSGVPPSALYALFQTSLRKVQRRLDKIIAAADHSASQQSLKRSPTSSAASQVTATSRIACALQRALVVYEAYLASVIMKHLLRIDDPVTLLLRRHAWGVVGGAGDEGSGTDGAIYESDYGDKTMTYRTLPPIPKDTDASS